MALAAHPHPQQRYKGRNLKCDWLALRPVALRLALRSLTTTQVLKPCFVATFVSRFARGSVWWTAFAKGSIFTPKKMDLVLPYIAAIISKGNFTYHNFSRQRSKNLSTCHLCYLIDWLLNNIGLCKLDGNSPTYIHT